jgi:PAS domain S-box-containing protein
MSWIKAAIHPVTGKQSDDAHVAAEKYRALLDSFPSGILISDQNGIIVEVNEMASSLLGLAPGELLGRPVSDVGKVIVGLDGKPVAPEELASVTALKEHRLTRSATTGIVLSSGETRWLGINASPMSLPGFGVVITFADITGLRNVEAALRQSEGTLKELLEERGRIIADLKRSNASLSALNEIARAASSELELHSMLETVHRELGRVLDASNFFVGTVEPTGDSWTMQYKVEGGKRAAIVSHPMSFGLAGHIMRSHRGLLFKNVRDKAAFVAHAGIEVGWPEAKSWMGVPLMAAETLVGAMVLQSYERENLYSDDDFELFSTIAAQVAASIRNSSLYETTQRMLREVSESEERYRTVVEAANEGVLIVQDERVAFANNRMAKMLDRELESILGLNFTDLFSPKERERALADYRLRLSEEAVPAAYEIQMIDPSGKEIWANASVVRIAYQGRPATMAFVTDVSERVQRERERERLLADLTQALIDKRVLRGLLPICAGCKKIRDDNGYWRQIEQYISSHAPVEFSHGLCPECVRKYYPDVADEISKK